MKEKHCWEHVELDIHVGQRMESRVRSMLIRMYLEIAQDQGLEKWNQKLLECIMESLKIIQN